MDASDRGITVDADDAELSSLLTPPRADSIGSIYGPRGNFFLTNNLVFRLALSPEFALHIVSYRSI